jgi:hypothetical protein
MFKNTKNQVMSGSSGQPKAGLTERVDQYYAEKNAWKKMNGACPISADIEATLELLRSAVSPETEDLADMIRTSVSKYAAEGQTFEQIWSYKMSDGANSVAVVDGVFGFYRGAEKLPTNNKPLRISAMPIVLELREKERLLIMYGDSLAKRAMMVNFREVKISVSQSDPVEEDFQFTQSGAALEMSGTGSEASAGQL